MGTGERTGRSRLRRYAKLIVGLSAIVIASGCSVASYERPVADFAAATQDAKTALSTLNDEVTEAYADVIRRQVLAGDGLVKPRSGDCLTGSRRCRLIVLGRDGRERTLTPAPALRTTIVLMNEIDAYAQGLAAIVAADTAAGITEQVNAALASLDNLAGTVGDLRAAGPGPSVDTTPYATAAGGLVAWAADRYVDARKIRALRRATADAKAVIAESANLFAETAEIAAVVPRQPMAEIVAQRIDALDDKQTASNLDKLIAAAAAYDRLLLARPPRLFQRMAAAHAALVDQLQGADLSLVVVIARIRAFKDEAQTLAAVLRELAEARADAEIREAE